MLTDTEMLLAIHDIQARQTVRIPLDEASDGPGEDTRTPRDPDGLLAEDAMARQREWFQC